MALPGWLDFSAGTFSGTPLNDDVGALQIKVTADDGNGGQVSDVFLLTIMNTNDLPAVANPIVDRVATQDLAFTFSVPIDTFADDDGDILSLTATLADDSPLPGWLEFTAGTFSGTPASGDVGVLSIKVIADDGNGALVNDIFQLTVTDTNDPPTVAAPILDQQAAEDMPFNFAIPPGTFEDVDGDVLQLTATLADDSDLPDWIIFAGSIFSGTPSELDIGTISIKVTASDGRGGIVNDTFDLTVVNTNDNPVLEIPIADQNAIKGSAFAFTVPANTFSDPDADVLTLTATLADDSPLPSWLDFSAGTFSGTPADIDVGTITVKVTADDGLGGSVSDLFDIAVATAPPTTVTVTLDTDRSTPEPNSLSYTDQASGTSVKVNLAGRGETSATLVLTIPDQQDRQSLLSVDLISDQPQGTTFTIQSRELVSVESISGNGARVLNLKTTFLAGPGIDMTGPVGSIHIASVADGAHFNLGGATGDTLTLKVSGAVGQPGGAQGVDFNFPGSLKNASAQAWYGGQWDIGSVGRVLISNGDFTPSVDIEGAFSSFQVRGGDFSPAQFHSGTGDSNQDLDPLNDFDGGRGQIRISPDRNGIGGAIEVNSLTVDGMLLKLEGTSIDAEVTASDEIRSIRVRSEDPVAQLAGSFTARRFGKIQSQGVDTQFDLLSTGTADDLGRRSAVDGILISGADWLGGQVQTQPGTNIGTISVTARRGEGGNVSGAVDLAAELVNNLKTVHILQDFTLAGNVKRATLGRVIGSTFQVDGQILSRLTTMSQASPSGFVDNTLELLNPANPSGGIGQDQAPGFLQIGTETNPARIRTK